MSPQHRLIAQLVSASSQPARASHANPRKVHHTPEECKPRREIAKGFPLRIANTLKFSVAGLENVSLCGGNSRTEMGRILELRDRGFRSSPSLQVQVQTVQFSQTSLLLIFMEGVSFGSCYRAPDSSSYVFSSHLVQCHCSTPSRMLLCWKSTISLSYFLSRQYPFHFCPNYNDILRHIFRDFSDEIYKLALFFSFSCHVTLVGNIKEALCVILSSHFTISSLSFSPKMSHLKSQSLSHDARSHPLFKPAHLYITLARTKYTITCDKSRNAAENYESVTISSELHMLCSSALD